MLNKSLFLILIIFVSRLFSEVSRQEVTFYASKGAGSNEMIPRKGLLVKRPKAKATILIMHGFGSDRIEVGPLRALLLKKYNVMSFDFRAHGKDKCLDCVSDSDDVCTMGYNEVYDVFGAVDYIKNDPELKDLPLIAFGLSMGAATAIEAQALDPGLFDAMFLDTPFSTSECFIQKLTDSLDFKFLGYEIDFIKRIIRQHAFTPIGQTLLKLYVRLKHGDIKVDTFVKPIYPIKSIKKVNIPVCLIVCKNDEKIPYKEVIRLVDEHPGATRLIITGGRQHCDSIFHMPEEYKSLLNSFVQDVISGEIEKQSKKEVLKFFLDNEKEDESSIRNVQGLEEFVYGLDGESLNN